MAPEFCKAASVWELEHVRAFRDDGSAKETSETGTFLNYDSYTTNWLTHFVRINQIGIPHNRINAGRQNKKVLTLYSL